MSSFNKNYRILFGVSKLWLSPAPSSQICKTSKRSYLVLNRAASIIKQKAHGKLLLSQFSRTVVQIHRPYVHPSLSYAFGRSDDNLMYTTVARELDRVVKDRPDDIGYISYAEDKQVSFRQLDHDINKVAKCLVKNFNLKKGDSLGIYAYNCYNWIVTQFACSKIGLILTPINPSYKSHELAYILETGKVKCLFMPGPKSCQASLNDHLKALQSQPVRDLAASGKLELRNVVFIDSENQYTIQSGDSSDPSVVSFNLGPDCSLHDWRVTENDGVVYKSLDEAEDANAKLEDACIVNQSSVLPEDIFAIYYTSGTTGKPKGACVSHFTVMNNVYFCQKRMRHGRPKDWSIKLATVLPMFHIFAGVLLTLGPILNRTTVIYSSYKYDVQAFVQSIIKHQANLTSLTPTILIDMLTCIEVNKLADQVPLKIVQSGGAALAPEVVSRTFGVLPNIEDLRIGYGSTENGSVATMQSCHEPSESKSQTVGGPLDFTEVRIAKAGTDQVVPIGERGEIQTRGFNTMTEYLNQPDKTAEAISPNGWYKTGDIGIMRSHGSIEVCGRLKQLIIKGGENIYPEEVEQMIYRLPYIEAVHVVGVPDKRFGEQVCAWVKLKPGFRGVESGAQEDDRKPDSDIHKDDILNFCKENMTYFKVPKYLLFVDEFPMTPTKKVQHHLMTKISCEKLGIKV